MDTIKPVDKAMAFIDWLEKDPHIPEHLEVWLKSAFTRYRGGHEKTLDDALGLSVGPGQAHDRLPAVWRKRERNRLIRQAAGNLTADHGKVLTAKLIAFAMNTAIPNLHTPNRWETVVVLSKLRKICMNQVGDSNLALGWKRTLEIINGDGCS
jgi:hypothetical protein